MDLNLVDSCLLIDVWFLSLHYEADVVRPRQHQYIAKIKRDRF